MHVLYFSTQYYMLWPLQAGTTVFDNILCFPTVEPDPVESGFPSVSIESWLSRLQRSQSLDACSNVIAIALFTTWGIFYVERTWWKLRSPRGHEPVCPSGTSFDLFRASERKSGVI